LAWAGFGANYTVWKSASHVSDRGHVRKPHNQPGHVRPTRREVQRSPIEGRAITSFR